jgi:L-fucose mutarotase/ribose pyranase (RbsD/FucU family)
VCDGAWLLGILNGIRGRFFANMAEITKHTDAIHFRDHFFAESGQATVLRFEVAGSGIVLRAVRQLHDAHTQVLKDLDIVQPVFQRLSVLPIGDDAEFASLLGLVNISDAANGHGDIGVLADQALPSGDNINAVVKVFPQDS